MGTLRKKDWASITISNFEIRASRDYETEYFIHVKIEGFFVITKDNNPVKQTFCFGRDDEDVYCVGAEGFSDAAELAERIKDRFLRLIEKGYDRVTRRKLDEYVTGDISQYGSNDKIVVLIGVIEKLKSDKKWLGVLNAALVEINELRKQIRGY